MAVEMFPPREQLPAINFGLLLNAAQELRRIEQALEKMPCARSAEHGFAAGFVAGSGRRASESLFEFTNVATNHLGAVGGREALDAWPA